ncbi:HlyD family secretion protein [Flavobacterium psychrophilum]|uniref:HlyD family secretion protein n=1 Tax=Flavobacterium psychrophilum TaxID=96345 RepID=UPI0006187635|nr:HlyD family efflux transporter periplasmic adaptor subunit [Flavobacterium psychrophilum]OAE91994.1 secretion protein HlyD [Flavobacterium psychrophilum]
MNFSSDPINTIENLIAKNKTKSISVYLVIVLAVIFFLALLPVIKVDISSQSRGIIRSRTDNVPVTSMVSGKIVWIALKNNATIHKGDTLIKIAKEGLITEKKTQDTLSVSVVALLTDVSSLLVGKSANLKTAVAREDFYKYQSQKTELQSKVSQSQINYNRNKTLFDKGVIAKAEYEKYLFELRFASQALQSFIKQQKATWENQKMDLQERQKNLQGAVAKIEVEENNYVVVAPESGTIENFTGLQLGSFVNASQPIATISPTHNLLVESTVSPNDIGLIKKNQLVKFQIDAFNYNQWGFLEGKVIDIDHNITMQNNQTFFKVRCSLNGKVMQLKSGYKTQVTKGMTLTTRYIITRRSLFDLLFDKMDDWLNPKLLNK